MRYFVRIGMTLLSIAGKIARVRFILSKMEGNPYFHTPVPALATVETATNTLEAASLAAKGAGPIATAYMRLKEKELDILVKQLSSYVETVANSSPEDAETVILSSGFDLRRQTTRWISDFAASATSIPGEIKLQHKAVSRGIHEIQVSTDPTDEKNWSTIYQGTRGRIVVQGYAPGTWYYFRARVITKDGVGAWSEVCKVYLIS